MGGALVEHQKLACARQQPSGNLAPQGVLVTQDAGRGVRQGKAASAVRLARVGPVAPSSMAVHWRFPQHTLACHSVINMHHVPGVWHVLDVVTGKGVVPGPRRPKRVHAHLQL